MKRLRVGTYQTKLKEALMDNGTAVVWATHPECPNDSMNARGRVLHLERTDEKFQFPATYCGMRCVQYAKPLHARRICLQCSKIRDQENARKEPHDFDSRK